jgi:stage V sporulation protein S
MTKNTENVETDVYEMEMTEDEKKATLRVGSKTEVKALAGAITATVKNNGYVYLRAIGDGAIGRAMRAATISSGHLKMIGINLISESSYFITSINGNERTGLKILCEDR